MTNEEICYAIERIEHMEKMFDDAQNIFSNDKSAIDNPSFQKKMSFLTQYMESGQWLRDFSLDEKGLLPKDLKRGILSEDGLYNFICDVEHEKQKKSHPIKAFFSKFFNK